MKSKWVAILLIVSLALNLIMVGFWTGSRSVAAPGFDPIRSYPRWAHGLAEPRRDALRPVMREHLKSMRPTLRALRQRHRALRDALTAEPFDAQVLEEALVAMREDQARMQSQSHASFAEFVTQLTPAERRQLAADMDGPGRHHKRPPPPAHHRPGG